MPRTRNTGIETIPPTQVCEDKNCPYHGNLKVRGKLFTGTVVSDKMQRSAVVTWTVWKFIPKYERYKRIRTKISAHNPKCIDAKEGDIVLIGECRPISKTKNFVILQVKGKEKVYGLKKESVEEGRFKAGVKETKKKNEDKAEKKTKNIEKAKKPSHDAQ